MKLARIAGPLLLLAGSAALARSQEAEINVNTRYTVEGILISGDGWTADVVTDQGERISSGLRRDLMAIIGEKLNPLTLETVAKRLGKEFRARSVSSRLLRGASPEYVRVVFDLTFRPTRFEISVPKFLYHSKQGWSGTVEGTAAVKRNSFTFGLVSDGDELIERKAGVLLRYEHSRLGSDRVKLGFEFDSFHTQWNRSTSEALMPVHAGDPANFSGVYRTRQNFQPSLTFVLAKPLTLTVGTSFQRFQMQYPEARTEAANALTGALRYQRRLESADLRHNLDASYQLRAATAVLNSDFAYARHRWHFQYSLSRGRHTLLDEAIGGIVTGRAPLYERYVLGNNSTLRGWNKWELDPLGGNRMVHNTVEYRYGIFQVFYDTGAVWDSGQNAFAKHSIGAGFRHGVFSLAVALPVKDGKVEPIFMVGMNY